MDYIWYMGEYLGGILFKGTHIFPLIKQAENHEKKPHVQRLSFRVDWLQTKPGRKTEELKQSMT